MKTELGLSGSLAARFQSNALTPLLAITAIMLGATHIRVGTALFGKRSG